MGFSLIAGLLPHIQHTTHMHCVVCISTLIYIYKCYTTTSVSYTFFQVHEQTYIYTQPWTPGHGSAVLHNMGYKSQSKTERLKLLVPKFASSPIMTALIHHYGSIGHPAALKRIIQ